MRSYHMYRISIFSLFFLLALSACNADDLGNHNVSNPASEDRSDANSQTQAQQSAEQLTSKELGRTAFIDPVTGELISEPSVDNMNQLEAANRAQLQYQAPLVEQQMPDGSVKVDLQERFHSQVTATIEKNGKLKIRHEGSNPLPNSQTK